MPNIMQKGEFARHIGVTPGRVSQLLKAKTIDGDAIVGVGRSAMIDSEKAKAQLRHRLDATQMNIARGVYTKLDPTPASDPDDDLDEATERLGVEALKTFDRLLAEWQIPSLKALAEVKSEALEAFRQAEATLRSRLARV